MNSSAYSTSELSVWRIKILTLAVPIMLANATVPLVGIVDTAVMGRMSDPAYLGATAIGATIFSSIFWLFGFLRMGTSGFVAQAFGADDADKLRREIVRALFVAIIIGVLIVLLQAPLFAISKLSFGGSPHLMSLVQAYFDIRIWSAPATLVGYALMGGLIGLQKMRAVMAVQLVLNLTNILLNLYFFNILHWDIEGVALASVIADYIALAYSFFLVRRYTGLSLAMITEKALFTRQSIIQLVTVNGNLFVRTLCLIAAYYWLTAASTRLGELPLAANAILIQLLHLMAHSLDGFSNSAESLGGQAYGKKDRRAFDLTVRVTAEWCLLFALLITLIYALAGPTIIDWMTSLVEVREYAARYLPWVILAPIISVWGFLYDGIYIGVTHTREMRNGMLISLAIFIVATWLLVPRLGNHGLWASYYLLMLFRTLTLAYWYKNILAKFNPNTASAIRTTDAN